MNIDQLCGELQKLAGIFYRIRSKLSQTCLKAIYFAFVHPHLLYGVELYANTGITHLSKLITLNNKILWILQNKANNAPVKELYTAYTTLPIPQLHSSCSYWFINSTVISICYPRFFVTISSLIKVCIAMKLGTKLVSIYAV